MIASRSSEILRSGTLSHRMSCLPCHVTLSCLCLWERVAASSKLARACSEDTRDQLPAKLRRIWRHSHSHDGHRPTRWGDLPGLGARRTRHPSIAAPRASDGMSERRRPAREADRALRVEMSDPLVEKAKTELEQAQSQLDAALRAWDASVSELWRTSIALTNAQKRMTHARELQRRADATTSGRNKPRRFPDRGAAMPPYTRAKE
jgi:hypothetical protein